MKNEAYIKCFCNVKNDNNLEIQLSSKGYFAPSHGKELHPSLRFYYCALIQKDAYQLYLCSNIDEIDNPAILIITSSDETICPTPSIHKGTWRYLLSAEELSELCAASSLVVDGATTIFKEYDDFNELIIYSRRFFNLLVDRSKYSYTQSRYIICDSL
ncbi:MAG: hypothetical protein J6T02_02075 [Bacteroidales bacterium]|nr:hypothetical protein [Bacteroidales bacterium]